MLKLLKALRIKFAFVLAAKIISRACMAANCENFEEEKNRRMGGSTQFPLTDFITAPLDGAGVHTFLRIIFSCLYL